MAASAQPTAVIGVDEFSSAYYTQGWDSQDEFDTWTYEKTSSSTWKLGNRSNPFSTVDPASTSSLILGYSSDQNEKATSPELEIRPGSQLEFYCYAAGTFLVYGAWNLYAIVDGESYPLVDQFQWAQKKGYTGPSWEKFTVDLANYAGKKVKFMFEYKGNYGEDEAIDGFRLTQPAIAEGAQITLYVGEQLHFHDLTPGNVASRSWTFSGGNPVSSEEKDPVVTYDKAGTYDVTLQVTMEGGETATVERKDLVVVEIMSPTAHIGLPAGAYLSPNVDAFIPANTEVQFRDESTGTPNGWEWVFDWGANHAVSYEQNPVVSLPEAGLYEVHLLVSNDGGTSEDIQTIQAGGQQNIWNIDKNEQAELDMIEMGWYGNYGGTNWLGMAVCAEHYDAPMAEATVESVDVYFGKTTAATTDAVITLSLCKADADGMPGEEMASTTLKASQLKDITTFTFNEPVVIDDEFFVSIGGFPNENGDDIAMQLVRRGEGKKCTGYQFVLDYDDDTWEYLETGKWYKNTDDPLSIAIAPLLIYEDPIPTSVDMAVRESGLVSFDGDVVRAMKGVSQVEVFDVDGRCVAVLKNGGTLSMGLMGHGIYVVRAVKDGKKYSMKFVR